MDIKKVIAEFVRSNLPVNENIHSWEIGYGARTIVFKSKYLLGKNAVTGKSSYQSFKVTILAEDWCNDLEGKHRFPKIMFTGSRKRDMIEIIKGELERDIRSALTSAQILFSDKLKSSE